MFEDADYKRQMKKAESNRALDPHKMDELKRKQERKIAQDRAKLRRDVTVKKLEQDSKKAKEEDSKKGILTINQKEDARKLQDDEKRKADADKVQGQTEKPTQTV